MTKYNCGHKCESVILDDNELSVAGYLDWKDDCGWNGDKSLCWVCYCKKGFAGSLGEVKG